MTEKATSHADLYNVEAFPEAERQRLEKAVFGFMKDELEDEGRSKDHVAALILHCLVRQLRPDLVAPDSCHWDIPRSYELPGDEEDK